MGYAVTLGGPQGDTAATSAEGRERKEAPLMPEDNGTGRLDRIEAILDKLAERQREFHEHLRDLTAIMANDHERYDREMRQHLTWQVLTQEKMDTERKRLDELYAKTDERIAALVRAIGKLTERAPVPNKEAE